MGALTAGDRKNNTQGLFSEKDNMDSPLAQQAMFDVINNLLTSRRLETHCRDKCTDRRTIFVQSVRVSTRFLQHCRNGDNRERLERPL